LVTNRFPKQVRLLRAGDFERVFVGRASAADSSIVLHGAANELGHPRLGLVVSRRIGGAVRRNRWKRLLREAFRLTHSELPALDLVCIPRAEALPTLAALQQSFHQLAARIERKTSDAAQRPVGKTP
jgi:ribonuclease P protein component